ncbi:MAG: InlB B-repeat-containing protein, partial [Clostridia bacterium]|nr:InlB B-repeat-containing protein [Clostridia bacterium]
MDNSRANIRIISLILVIVMSMLTLVGCLPDMGDETDHGGSGNNNTGNNSNDNEGGNNNNPDNGTEDSHTCSFGDWIIVKEPTNSVDGLRERKCECGNVEQEVIAASNTEYYIQYRNLKTAQYPKENGYNSKEGLLNLPQPEADGYTFIGWYTASIGGELVDYIPEGSTKNYILYAHWELVSYEITYKNVPNNTNPTSYNIETKLKLETPKWSGLEFTHWSDNEGNTYLPDINITSLPTNMFGDLTLTANWKVLRNIATPAAENGTLYSVFSGEEGMLYFHYDLGTIEHVVLDDINPSLYYKSEGMPITLKL